MDYIPNPFKTGMIMQWSGSIATIPTGFALCNGTNGTPDLRDKFIVGAGTTYNPADTGGAASHNHVVNDPGHKHDLDDDGGFIVDDTQYHNYTTVDPTGITLDAGSHLPPYYALAYIMKL